MTFMSRQIVLTLMIVAISHVSRAQSSASGAWDSVGTILGARGAQQGGYQRYNFPRRDITLRVGDVTVSPSLALGTWAGFSGSPEDATMMGDLVLLTQEMKPVLAELARQGLDVNAIHNHLAGETPSIRNVHYHGQGRAIDLARRLDRVLALTATPRPVVPATQTPATFDTTMVFQALGVSGRAQGDVVAVTYMLVPGAVTMHGHSVEPTMSLRSPVSVQFVDPTRALATGDFAVPGERVDPVLDALANNGITATAVHSHLVGEQPTVYFIHFWADGRPADVLRGLRAAAVAGGAP